MPEPSAASDVFFGKGQIKTSTYKEQAYNRIKEAILYQKLKPNTTYSQEAFCQELGISRTPVREALLELQKEGYIRFWRGKGIRIVSLDKDAIHDIMEMRLCLEKETAEMAARRADPGDLEYICACLEESRLHLDSKDIDLCYRLDHKFHRAVGKAAHNQLLYRALDDVLDRYLQFEVLSIYQSYVDAHAIWEAHDHIYKAIAAGDADRARAAAKTHLEDAYRRTLEQYWIG